MDQPKKSKYNPQAVNDAYQLFVETGYKKSKEEFVKLIQTNPEALKDAHKLFTDTGYKKDVNEFSSLLGLKKKEVTDSTSAKPKSASVSGAGSSGAAKSKLPVYEEKEAPAGIYDIPNANRSDKPSKNPEGSMAWTQEKLRQDPLYTQNYDRLKQAEQIAPERIREIEKEVDNELTTTGFLNTVKSGIQSVTNALPTWLGGTTEKNNSPLAAEKEEAKKELLQQKVKVTPQAVAEKAKEIAIKKRIASEKQSQVESYLATLEDEKTAFGTTKREDLYMARLAETSSLSHKDQQLIKKQEVLRPALETALADATQLDAQIKKLKLNGQPILQELVQQLEQSQEKYNELFADAVATQEEFADNREALGDSMENLDLLKRNYGNWKNIEDNALASVMDAYSGLAGATDYYATMTGRPNDALPARIASRQLKEESDKVREGIMMPKSVEDINSLEDFGRWAANTTSQLVPQAALVAAGPGGLAAIGGSATGNKYEEMLSEMEAGTEEYNTAQLMGIPLAFGATETASAYVDRLLFKQAGRVIRSATEPERRLIAKGFAQSLIEGGKNVTKGATMEATEEAATQLSQNLLDRYAGDKENVGIWDGVKDAAAAGALFGALIPLGANTIAMASKPFTTDDSIEKTTGQLEQLRLQLSKPDLSDASRSVIEKQYGITLGQLKKEIAKTEKQIGSLSDEQFESVLDIEKEKAKLRRSAQEIEADASIDEGTKELLKSNLKKEYDANEQRRLAIIKGTDGQAVDVNNTAAEDSAGAIGADSTTEGTGKTKAISDEAAQGSDTEVNGSVRPAVTELGQDGIPEPENTQPESPQPAADAGASQSEPKRIKVPAVRNSEFDITFDANGAVSKITSVKDGREVPKFTERTNPRTGKKSLVRNGNYSSIESAAMGTETNNKLNEERKAKVKEAVETFEPNDPYSAALRYFATGGRISRDSTSKETGVSAKEAFWAAGMKQEKDLPSIERASEIISEGTDIDQAEVRDALIDIVLSKTGITQIEDEIVSLQDHSKREATQRELDAYKSTLSEAELAVFDDVTAEDDYITELTDEEAIAYYEQQIENYEQGKRATEPGQEADTQRVPEDGSNEAAPGEEATGSAEETGVDEGESNLQGINLDSTPQRDLSLSENGPPKDLLRKQRKFRRFWAQTFRSNAGLDSATAETIRSRNRDIASFTDALNYEAGLFKKILNDVTRKDPAKFNSRALAINDYLAGQESDVSFLTAKQKDQLDYFRERIDALSDSLVTILEDKLADMQSRLNASTSPIAKTSIEVAIERTTALIDTVKANKTTYLNRSYQIFSDDNYAKVLTVGLNEMNNVGRDKIRNAVNYLVNEEGYSKEDAEAYIADYLDGIKTSQSAIDFISSGKANAPFLKKRKTLPPAFRELLGESKDPLTNYVGTVYKISYYIANLEYQGRMRDTLLDSGIGKTEPGFGYTKLTSDGEGWQTLSEIYVPNEVKEAMDDMMPLPTINSGAYKAWIKFAAFTKIGKTVGSPTTMARNLYSGVFLGLNSGHFSLMNPEYAARAFNQAWGTAKSQTQLKAERQKLIRLGIIGDGANAGELAGILNDFSKESSRMIKRNKFEYSLDLLKKAYAFGDDFYKVGGFYIEKQRLIDAGVEANEAELMAANRINNGYPTYSYLPKNLQRLRRFPLVGTFVSFPYETIRTTYNNAKFVKEDYDAGRIKMAAQRAAGMVMASSWLAGASALTAALVGIDDEDDDAIRDMQPEWQKNSQMIYLGTKNGKPVFIDGTALAPAETFMKPLGIIFEQRAGRDFDEKLYIAGEEFLKPYLGTDISFKTAWELLNNRDQYDQQIYKGKNIFEGFLNEPDNIANHYMKQAGPGVYNNISEFMRANEIAPGFFGEKYTAYGKEYTNSEALLGLLGFRLSTINYSNGITSFGYQVKDEYDYTRKNVLDGLKTTKKLSEDDITKLVNEYKEVNDDSYEKLNNIVTEGLKLGMSQDDIKNSLKSSGISASDARLLSKGAQPLLKPVAGSSESKFKDKLDVNYGDDSKALKSNFDANVEAFEKAIKKLNDEIRKKNDKILK